MFQALNRAQHKFCAIIWRKPKPEPGKHACAGARQAVALVAKRWIIHLDVAKRVTRKLADRTVDAC